MVGNPLAFVHLEAFSQVRRRFSLGGIQEFLPAESSSTDWWAQDFVPQIRKFSLVEKEVPMTAQRMEREFELTGGNPSFYISLWTLAQQEALRNAAVNERSSASLTMNDIEKAAKSPQYAMIREDAQVLGEGEAALKAGHRLIDVPASARKRNADRTAADSQSLQPHLPDPSPAQAVQKLVRNLEANFKRLKNDTLARAEALQALTREQREMLGLQHDLVDAAQGELASGPTLRRAKR
jgi:hypothetical protein